MAASKWSYRGPPPPSSGTGPAACACTARSVHLTDCGIGCTPVAIATSHVCPLSLSRQWTTAQQPGCHMALGEGACGDRGWATLRAVKYPAGLAESHGWWHQPCQGYGSAWMQPCGPVTHSGWTCDAAVETFQLQFGQLDVTQQQNGGRGRSGRLESSSNAWWHDPFRPRAAGVLVFGPDGRQG